MNLCEYIKCEPPTVTNMVKWLEVNGFIYLKRDEHDARLMRFFYRQRQSYIM
nr:MarR family transcriptional regulator [Paenibacillus xylanexedens]